MPVYYDKAERLGEYWRFSYYPHGNAYNLKSKPIKKSLSCEPKKQQNRQDEYRKTALYRMAKDIHAYVLCNFAVGHLWSTLCFDEDVSYMEALDRGRYFVQKTLKRFLKQNFKYLLIVERDAKGKIHSHLITDIVGEIPQDVFQRKWGHGFAWINKVMSQHHLQNIAYYMGKSFRNPSEEVYELRHINLYPKSNNLKKAEIYIGREAYEIKKQVQAEGNHKLVYRAEYKSKFNGNTVKQRFLAPTQLTQAQPSPEPMSPQQKSVKSQHKTLPSNPFQVVVLHSIYKTPCHVTQSGDPHLRGPPISLTCHLPTHVSTKI